MLRPFFMLDRVSQSLGELYRLLERPRAACYAVVALLAVVHTGLLGYSAYVHSPTLNEPGHLVAGLSHWKFGRFELYRVNPPLVRMVAALPVMAVGYEEDWSGFHEGPGARPVFGMGSDFVAANGERSFFLFMVARWACIPFSWLGAVVCFLWARDLSGKPAGVMACSLWCFSPNILAHASLITADVGGTALGVAACYTFWRWLKKPTWTQAALTGCVLGLAELCKTTLILFYPLWPLLWVAYRWSARREMHSRDWIREAGMLVLRMAIGLYVLNLGYGFEGSFKPLQEFHFVSELFTGQEESDKNQEPSNEVDQNTSINRFAGTLLGRLPVPFPKNYLLGIDIQQRDFEIYGRPSYLCGEWQDHGWWYYYLYAAAIKVPLGTWLLGLLTLLITLCSSRPAPHNSQLIPHWKDDVVLLFPALLIFTVCSAKTGFSEHFRYVLPCFSFLFIFLSRIATRRTEELQKVNKIFLDEPKSCHDSALVVRKCTRSLFARSATLIFFLWSVASSLWIYPHSLSYFNESIGGPLKGTKHLLGSNVDWGQDLRYAKWWSEDYRVQQKYFASEIRYFGFYDPKLVEAVDNPIWNSNIPAASRGLRAAKMEQKVATGCYQISVNLLFRPPAIDLGRGIYFHINGMQALQEPFQFKEPSFRNGYSIWYYLADVSQVPRE